MAMIVDADSAACSTDDTDEGRLMPFALQDRLDNSDGMLPSFRNCPNRPNAGSPLKRKYTGPNTLTGTTDPRLQKKVALAAAKAPGAPTSPQEAPAGSPATVQRHSADVVNSPKQDDTQTLAPVTFGREIVTGPSSLQIAGAGHFTAAQPTQNAALLLPTPQLLDVFAKTALVDLLDGALVASASASATQADIVADQAAAPNTASPRMLDPPAQVSELVDDTTPALPQGKIIQHAKLSAGFTTSDFLFYFPATSGRQPDCIWANQTRLSNASPVLRKMVEQDSKELPLSFDWLRPIANALHELAVVPAKKADVSKRSYYRPGRLTNMSSAQESESNDKSVSMRWVVFHHASPHVYRIICDYINGQPVDAESIPLIRRLATLQDVYSTAEALHMASLQSDALDQICNSLPVQDIIPQLFSNASMKNGTIRRRYLKLVRDRLPALWREGHLQDVRRLAGLELGTDLATRADLVACLLENVAHYALQESLEKLPVTPPPRKQLSMPDSPVSLG